jgi:2'-5' RNA ligase
MRLFFALDICLGDKSAIKQWRQQHLALLGKPVSENNYHITLAFLGLVSTKQQTLLTQQIDNNFDRYILENNGPKIRGKTLTLGKLELFEKPQVLYLSLISTPHWLNTLANHTSNQSKTLGIKQELRPYLPHLSLYRKIRNLHEDTKRIQCNLEITVTSFSLYHSYSSENKLIYQPIKTWCLEQKK